MTCRSAGTDWSALWCGVGAFVVVALMIVGICWRGFAAVSAHKEEAETPMEDCGIILAVHRFQSTLMAPPKTEIVTDKMSIMLPGHPDVPLGKRLYYRAASAWKGGEYEWREK